MMNTQGFPTTFEGSYLGDRARLAPGARLECKVCWHVYDPAEGCEVWQIPPGTPFTALPEHWRCPVCDGARDQFMVLDGGAEGMSAVAAVPSAREAHIARLLAEVPARLEATFREIHAGRMKGVPFVNGALAVKAVGFRAHEGRGIGVLVTPWFMNIILLPGLDDHWADLATGTRAVLDFPSGSYEFLSASRPETGPYKSCSLFSPMFDFASMPEAVETAEAVIPALFDPANREEGTRAGEIRRQAQERARAEAAEGTTQGGIQGGIQGTAQGAAQGAAPLSGHGPERDPAHGLAAKAPAGLPPMGLSRRAMLFGPQDADRAGAAASPGAADPRAGEAS